MTYPVELPGGFSGLSAGQIQGIAKAPFTGHFSNVPMLGDRRPKTLVAATGLWFFDSAPHGDFSGTTQGGGGGPASMEFSPTGSDTVVTIGRVRTSNTTSSFTGEQSITYAHSTYGYKIRLLNTHKAPITGTTADWTASSYTITKTGGFSSYTFTGWDMVYLTAGGQKGWYRIATRVSNDAITLTPDSSIFSSGNLTGTVSFEVYPCNFATYITGATWTEASKTITKTGGFSSYTAGTDDVVLVKGGTGSSVDLYTTESWSKVASKTDNNNIVLTDAAIADDATTDVDLILFKRPSYEERTIDTALANGTTITVTSAFTNTPRVGDLYYIYVDTIDGDDATDLAAPENDPEGSPTASAASTPFCCWPFNTFSTQVRMSLQGHQGFCTVPAARSNTQMNHAWWGMWTMPKETFVYGDRLKIDIHGGYDYNNTPFIFEILLIPNFDPEADWIKTYDVDSELRFSDKVIWFQTDPLYHTALASRDFSLSLVGHAGGFTRGAGSAAQYIQSWDLTMDFSPGDPTTDPYTAPTQQRRSFLRTFSASDVNLHSTDTRWTILIKTEHPSMKGKPGYHGYYFGEPFSATTGNGGGVWLHHTGAVAAASSGVTVKLPLAPRTRFTDFTVTYFPNGSY